MVRTHLARRWLELLGRHPYSLAPPRILFSLLATLAEEEESLFGDDDLDAIRLNALASIGGQLLGLHRTSPSVDSRAVIGHVRILFESACRSSAVDLEWACDVYWREVLRSAKAVDPLTEQEVLPVLASYLGPIEVGQHALDFQHAALEALVEVSSPDVDSLLEEFLSGAGDESLTALARWVQTRRQLQEGLKNDGTTK